MNKTLSILLLIFVCVAPKGAAQTYIQLVDSADYHIKRGEWRQAEQATVAALKSMPANKLNSHLWSNLGDIRTRLQDYDGALQAFEIGLAQNPRSTKILCNRAYTLLAMDRRKDALADINAALELDSLLAWPRRMRATMAMADNRIDDAERDFKFLMLHHPDLAAPYAGLGKIAALRGDADRGIEMLRKSIEIEHSEESWFYLVLLNIEQDRLQQASELLAIAMKRYSRSGNMYLLRGVIHKKRFENTLAETDKKNARDYGADPQLIERFFPRTQK